MSAPTRVQGTPQELRIGEESWVENGRHGEPGPFPAHATTHAHHPFRRERRANRHYRGLRM